MRLLGGCEDASKWPVLLGLLHDPSPLVRSSAASALGGHLTPEVLKALLAAAADPSRLVRIRTAMSLAALPPQSLTDRARSGEPGEGEPRFHRGHAGPAGRLGVARQPGQLLHGKPRLRRGRRCFETATKLEPRQIGPMVNASMAYSNLDQNDKAEQSLRRALKMEPDNAAANFNLGLLLAEQGRFAGGRAVAADRPEEPIRKWRPRPTTWASCSAKRICDEAIAWCQKAHDLRPEDPKYAHTLAFYQRKKGDTDGPSNCCGR